jgi:hypothetical protein
MPNWCNNNLTITGEQKEIEKFREYLDFNRFLPYMENFPRLDEEAPEWKKQNMPDGKFKTGVNWEDCPAPIRSLLCTKWGVINVTVNPGKTTICFQTAWSPPIPDIEKAGEMFPAIHFELQWIEPLNGFNGIFRMSGGQVTANESGEPHPWWKWE